MIVDRSHQQWIFRVAFLAAAAAALYAVHLFGEPNAPRGGSAVGLVYGFSGTAVFVFECLLSLRKKYPASPFGRVQTWLQAHIWLGLLGSLLILFHAGFRWGRGLAGALMWLLLIITLSGVYGLILQNYLPRRMTELVRRETIYEQIPGVVRLLRLEADERVEFITADLGVEEAGEEEIVRAGGRKFYFDPGQRKSALEKVDAERQKRKAEPQIIVDEQARQALRAHYLQEIRPYLFPRPAGFSRRLFSGADSVAAYFRYLRTVLPVAANDVLRDLESICEERRQLGVQERLHFWLHNWLYVHAPLSMGFLVLVLIHAAMSLRY